MKTGFGLIAAFALVLAACGGQDDPAPAEPVDPPAAETAEPAPQLSLPTAPAEEAPSEAASLALPTGTNCYSYSGPRTTQSVQLDVRPDGSFTGMRFGVTHDDLFGTFGAFDHQVSGTGAPNGAIDVTVVSVGEDSHTWTEDWRNFGSSLNVADLFFGELLPFGAMDCSVAQVLVDAKTVEVRDRFPAP